MRCLAQSKSVLLFFGIALVLAILFLHYVTRTRDELSISYVSFGSAPEFLTPDNIQWESTENSTLVVNISNNADAVQGFLQLSNSVLTACNAPFVKLSKKPRYSVDSHEHVASIVMLSTGYHTPTAEDRDKFSTLRPFMKQVSCDYEAAAEQVFADLLFTNFVKELRKLLESSAKWRKELGYSQSAKSNFNFEARCDDGQLTTFGLAQHLSTGRKLADAFRQSASARQFLLDALKGSNRKLPVTLRQSKANTLGVLASVFGLASDLGLAMSLRELADGLRLTYSDYDNLCDTNTISAPNLNVLGNFSVPTCQCDAVKLVQHRVASDLDKVLISFYSAEGISNRTHMQFVRMLDQYGVSRSEPHNLYDQLHELHVAVCSLPDTLLCKTNEEQRSCLTVERVNHAFAALKDVSQLLRDLNLNLLSVLRSFPFGHSLLNKVLRVTTSEGPPVELVVVDSLTLTDLVRMLNVPMDGFASPLRLPFGSTVVLDLFRTTRRQPGTLVARLLVNGVSSLSQSVLCNRPYSGMCGLQELLSTAQQLLPSYLSTFDYGKACVGFAKSSL